MRTEISLGTALDTVAGFLGDGYPLSRRFLALLLLEGDPEIRDMVRAKDAPAIQAAEEASRQMSHLSKEPLEYHMALFRKHRASQIARRVVKQSNDPMRIRRFLDSLMMHPLSGGLFLLAVLYVGLYQFVGVFAAGTVVDFLEDVVFGKGVNPVATTFVTSFVRWTPIQDLLVGEYGVITLGLRYAAALILPIVTFFFIVFSILEDTGYLPRLAMLLDRIFKQIGLSGRAVIPMVLGFGCVTMATLVTRTLPTKRERLIATFLLSLAIPCSAQLGVVLAILTTHPKALLLWMGVLCLVFLLAGFVVSRMLPGERPSFYMELPPLRLPDISNVFMKTYSRVKWYFLEIMPLFLWVSVMIWAGQITGIFRVVVGWISVPLGWVGLPAETAPAFLFGFFRRDYGAAGLFDLNRKGLLDGRELLVSAVALTLFLPCVAQFLINIKERGLKTGLVLSGVVLLFSISVAFVLNFFVTKSGIVL